MKPQIMWAYMVKDVAFEGFEILIDIAYLPQGLQQYEKLNGRIVKVKVEEVKDERD